MRAVVVRGFFSRKLRAVLTGIAVALGVALMSGTYILTDTIDQSFASIFASGANGRSVVVVPHQGLGANAAVQTAPISDATLAKVRAVPGVAVASGEIFSIVSVFDSHGKRLNSRAPSFVSSTLPARFENFSAISGSLPRSSIDVAVDQASAQRDSLAVGQTLRIAGAGASRTYRIAGIVKFAGSSSFGGAGVALVTPSQAQYISGEPGQWDELVVAATPSVSSSVLRARIRAVLPPTLDVRTGLQQAAKQTSDLESQLGFLRTFLLIFAYVSLFVGAFIIFNTFSITVAQRTREFGLLRTLGASRSQIMRSVIYEGFLLGTVGAVLGLFGGLLLAPALDQLFKSFGADLPDSGTVLETRTIVVSLLVGIGVTVLAGLAPAIRATRVPPIAAMREGVGIPPRPLPTKRQLIARFLIGLVVVLAVTALTGAGGLGLVLLVVWCLRALRLWVRLRRGGERPVRHYRIVPALARAIGSLIAWRGITARLAKENSIRQPGRTLTTAAALTVGLALVTLVAVLADGTKATINQAVSRTFAGNLIVENSQAGNEAGIPALVAPSLRRVPGVATVTAVGFTEGRVRGSTSNVSVTAIEPDTFSRVYRVEWKQGSDAALPALDDGGTILAKAYAESHHLKVGRTVSLLTPTGRHVPLRVVGIASDNARLLGNFTIALALARQAFGLREDALDFVAYKSGYSDSQVQPAVDRLLASQFPQARSRTAAQFKEDQANQINTLLALIYVLLALSVIVSLFGIVNTLILSIYERTRELGMMRAIGTSRRQVRQMIRYESVITALVGGVLGIVLGIAIAAILDATALSGSGFVFVVPPVTMIVLFVLSGLAGLVAAAWPARRAASLDPIVALRYE